MPDESLPSTCPVCSAKLAKGSVLCVACGYHLKLGYHLSTLIEAPTEKGVDDSPVVAPSDNPYASPQLGELSSQQRVLTPDFDLTDYGASWAKAVVTDADMSLALSFLCCFCGPLWLVMFPWYSYRIYCWHTLNSTYAELRYPNSFSPHGDLPMKFQESRFKLYRGAIVGFCAWIFVAFWWLTLR